MDQEEVVSLSKPQTLALYLIESLEDENIEALRILLTKYRANPNLLVITKKFAAVHYVSGMESSEFSVEASGLIFGQFNGDPNVKEIQCGMTPMHIAASNGNHQVFQLMLQKGGDLELKDNDQMTALGYAVQERYHEVIQIAYDHIMELKKKKEAEMLLSPLPGRMGRTANGEPTNLNPASPYYIYITHRRRPATPRRYLTELQVPENTERSTFSTPRRVNLMELTSTNLQEFSNLFSDTSSGRSRIEIWREQVYSAKTRYSITRNIKEMEEIVSNMDDLDTTVDTSSPVGSVLDSEFFTAHDSFGESLKLRRSPTVTENSVLQLKEIFRHSDSAENIQFLEMKYHPPVQEAAAKSDNGATDLDQSLASQWRVPSDYGTEKLRQELTALGDPPGPITNTTKRLYQKRLMRYQRNPELAPALTGKSVKCNFSVELRNTLNVSFLQAHLSEYLKMEQDMVESFKKPQKKWREGNLKTSFIYLLIDPRVSKNLPAFVSTMSKEKAWQIFLTSIFYVGKGKSSRPYSHLYEAIRHFEDYYLGGKRGAVRNRKLTRIMEIWDSENGVVCLHVFHNILPVEAFTREASLIDCLGLQHLTNQKRGDYYGAPAIWTMRQKKQMGVAILFKALQVFLAEGENQLSPCDLLKSL